MNQTIFVSLIVVAAELFVAAQCQAGCGHLFQHKVVVQQVVAVPQVLYFAGQATHDEALLRKAIRAELQLAMQQMQQQPPIQQQNANATGSVLQTKCAKCHSGDAAKGGLDLTRTITAEDFRRSMELLGTGRDAPSAMKAVLGSLTSEDKGRLMEELLQLSARPAASRPEPHVSPPDPFEQPSVPGVLR